MQSIYRYVEKYFLGMLCFLGMFLPTVSAFAYPTNLVGSTFVLTSGTIRAMAPKVAVWINSPYVIQHVGDKLQLLQKNDDYFIGIVEREYEKEKKRICAFPLMSRKSRQKSAWTTKSGLMFFGYKTTSCNGVFYLRDGEDLSVLGMTDTDYQVEIQRYGHKANLWIPKTTLNIEYTPGVLSTSTATLGPVRTIITGTAETTHIEVVRGGNVTTLTNVNQRLSQGTHSKLADLFAAQQRLKTSRPTRKTTVVASEIDEPWFEVEEEPEPVPEVKPELPVIEEPVEVETVPIVDTNEVIDVVEESEPVEDVDDTNELSEVDLKEAGETDTAGGVNLQALVMSVFGVFLVVLVAIVVVKKVRGGEGKEARTSMSAPVSVVDSEESLADVSDKDVDMSGHIASSSLGDVAQFLNAGKETGNLSIKNEEGEPVGRMVFDKGELVDAESPGHCGVEAVYDLLRHKDGFFSFVRQPEDSIEERTITQGTISLLLDVYRVIDEENSEMQ